MSGAKLDLETRKRNETPPPPPPPLVTELRQLLQAVVPVKWSVFLFEPRNVTNGYGIFVLVAVMEAKDVDGLLGVIL